MIMLISIFCSLCLRRHSKQEKQISAVRDVSILLFTDSCLASGETVFLLFLLKAAQEIYRHSLPSCAADDCLPDSRYSLLTFKQDLLCRSLGIKDKKKSHPIKDDSFLEQRADDDLLSHGRTTLPLALRCFTSEFGKGSGGAIALLSSAKGVRYESDVIMTSRYYLLVDQLVT